MSKAERPAEGVEFPKDAEGKRSTMGINKAAYASAMRAVDAEEAKKLDDLPDKKWRKGYIKGILEQVRKSAQSEKNALGIAQAGLDFLHEKMIFVRPAGAEDSAVSLKEAMKKYTDKKFITHEIQGTAPKASRYSVTYKTFGTPGPLKDLTGDVLHKQVDTWVKNGTIEASCGNAIDKVADNPEWCDLSDVYIVLFGATSAMGPFYKLMDHGANVIALDLDRQPIWERLIRDTRARAGKLIFPVKEAIPAGASDEEIAKRAGCNLLTDTPEIRTWLTSLFPKEKLVCMALAYLDAAMFVKVSCAMDAIISSLIETRGADKVAPAYLCTPTDAHLCTAASVEASKANMRRAPMWHSLVAPLLAQVGMPMKKNVEKPLLDAEGNVIEGLHVVDALIPEQGPNYALAKRLQHWRALVSRSKGCTVSSNVAPATATASVLSNALFALGYKGMSAFRPMEVTFQETSNSVMAALLIRDIRDPTAAANPKTPLKNPLCLFTDNAFHGGCWRTGLKFASIGAPSAIGYLFFNFITTPYLLFYSLYQSYGWGKVLATVLTAERAGLWGTIGGHLSFFQKLGLMEVAHAALGMTKSSPGTTLLQIFSRIFVIAAMVEDTKYYKENTTIIPLMFFCWSLADFTRYVYYAFQTARELATSGKGLAVALKFIKLKQVEKADDPPFKTPFPLTWVRYSLFIVLYPTGVFCELASIYSMLGTLANPDMKPLSGPCSMDYWTMVTTKGICGFFGILGNEYKIMSCIGVAYAFGLPLLYMMLLAARKKNLAPKPKEGGSKKNK
mmetsp:Transcript_152119/g.276679  ORF Transcript_152119/g.276679 Transcript_152119/m.276679 type:complete len:787 (+) Transcript_152119:70-2430(+)